MNQPLPLRLPDDRPKVDQGAEDTARLGSVIDVLTTHLSEFLRNKRTMPPPRIGVFGGLGQGKTSALNGVRKVLVGDGDIKPHQIRVFNASFYHETVLAQEFDRLAASWGLISHLKAGVFWSLLLFLAFSVGYWLILFLTWLFPDTAPTFLGQKPEFAWHFQVWILAGSLFAGFAKTCIVDWLTPAYRFWRRDMERHLNLGGKFWLPPLFNPDVLLVDDLDRATPLQQRAVLRALYKHSEALHMAVVVCMDETRLFAAGDLPDSPAELLRKVINVECRLPMRVREDHLDLIGSLLDEYIELNSGLPWCILLNHPLVQGDLVRVFSLLPEFGPRRCKRLLNDWLLHVQQLSVFCDRNQGQNLPCIEDCAALLRLQGIFDLAPALRDGGETLLNALEANNASAFKALASRCFLDETQPQSQSLIQFLDKTRHLQPANGVWRTLIISARSQTVPDENPGADQCHQVCLGYSAAAWGYLRLNLPTNLPDKIRAKDARCFVRRLNPPTNLPDKTDQEPLQILQDSLLNTACWSWSAAECILAAAQEAQPRLLVYKTRLNELLDLSGDPADEGDKQLALFLLLRVWTADEQAIHRMTDSELHNVLDQIEKADVDFHHLAFRLPPSRLAFGQRLRMLNTRLSEQGSQGLSNLLPILRQWLAMDEPGACDFPTDELGTTIRLGTWNHGVLNAIWPPLSCADDLDPFILRLDWHLQWAAWLMQQGMALNKTLLDVGVLVKNKDILQRAQAGQKAVELARVFVMAVRKPDSGLADMHTLRAIEGFDNILQWAIPALEPEYRNDPALWQNALWIGCVLRHNDSVEFLLCSLRTIDNTALIESLVALPDNPLWEEAVISPANLAKLLSNASPQHKQRLTGILLQRADYIACKKLMELPLNEPDI